MSPMLRVNQQVLAYLTPEAQNRVKALMRRGVDADLALTLIEKTMTEAEVYELPPKDDAESDL